MPAAATAPDARATAEATATHRQKTSRMFIARAFVPIGTNFTNVMAVATYTLARDISSRSAAYQSVLPSRPSRLGPRKTSLAIASAWSFFCKRS